MSACFSTGFVVYSGSGCISWILTGNQIVRIQFDHERELSGCPDQAGIYYLYIASYCAAHGVHVVEPYDVYCIV